MGNRFARKGWSFRSVCSFALPLVLGAVFLSAGGADAACPTVSCQAAACNAATQDTQTGSAWTCPTAGYNCCTPKTTASTSAGTVNFTNPLGYSTVEEMMTTVLSSIQKIIVMLALVFLVIGGVLYIISAGDDGKIKLAKGAITAALIGLAIGVAAPSFLKEIAGVLGWGGATPSGVQDALTLSQILTNILKFLLSLVGTLSIIMIVVGGFMYVMAAGDQARAETARKIILYSLIGVAVTLTSYIAVQQVLRFFV